MSTAWIIAALAIGAALGAFYFGGLWITVRRVVATTQQPALLLLLLFVSYLLRAGVVLLGFYLLMNGRWERLVACMAGFLLARTLVLRRLRDAEQDLNLQTRSVSEKRVTE